MGNFIAVVKGVSGSGKSSRVFQVLKYLENVGSELEDFKYIDVDGRERIVGVLVRELNWVFIGKIYDSGKIQRWQGYDSVTGYFKKSEYFSNFLRNNSHQYSFFVEGAGVTGTNRLRPLFLNEFCGFRNIFMRYYNYEKDQKEQYLDRIFKRSGKLPGKGTMWDKALGFKAEHNKAVEELELVGSVTNTSIAYLPYDTPINDFGEALFKYLNLGSGFIDSFNEFVKELDYININKFENW